MRRPSTTLLAALAVAGVLALTAGSCDVDSSGTGDAPISGYDDSSVFVINMPDGYPNVAVKCVGDTAIYASTHTEQRPATLKIEHEDPWCEEGGFIAAKNLDESPDGTVGSGD